MSPDIIQSTHKKLTHEQVLKWPGDVLAIEDASEFEWNGKEPIEGLGPIGSGRDTDQGFILHSTLAFGIISNKPSKINLKVLGLLHQQYYVRPPKLDSTRRRRSEDQPLETDLWRNAIKTKAIPKEACRKVIRVCDRAADIYEVITETEEYGCKYIIRSNHDRTVMIDESTTIKLFDFMRDLPEMGLTSIELRGRNGIKQRKIALQVRWQKVSLRAPSRPGFGIGKLPPMETTVVHVCGKDSETEEMLEWFLYTNIDVNSIEDAIKVVQYYKYRWNIEDYHKALKTGLRAENLQLETAQGLFAAIAIMSIVALRLIDLRESLRTNQDAPASESGLDALEIEVLSTYLKRELRTVACVALAIGRLGGHQNRRGDGMPGLLTLWIGMSRLLGIVEGVRLSSKINLEKFG
jgi:hypothetical protein